LLHRVALAQGHGLLKLRTTFPERLEVNGDAEGSADLILAPVAASDRRRLIVEDAHVGAQQGDNLLRLGHQLRLVLEKREDPDLDRGDPGVKAEDGACLAFALLVGDLLLVEGIGQDGKGEAVEPGRGLDDRGDLEPLEKLLACCLDLLPGRFGAGAIGEGLLDKSLLLLVGHRIAGGLEFLVEVLELLA